MNWIINKKGKMEFVTKKMSLMELSGLASKEQCVSCGEFEFGGTHETDLKRNVAAFFCWRDECLKNGELWKKNR